MAALALVSLVLVTLCASQVWYSVSTSVSPILDFTGADVDASFSSIILLIGLATLVGLYLKSRLAAVLHLLSLITTVIVAVVGAARVAINDLTNVESRIEKATGVAGWLMQQSEVVTRIDVTMWPIAALIPAAALIAALFFLAILSARRPSEATPKTTQVLSNNKTKTSDLWAETSKQL
jgi:hypothetical protein